VKALSDPQRKLVNLHPKNTTVTAINAHEIDRTSGIAAAAERAREPCHFLATRVERYLKRKRKPPSERGFP
jgi:hypothetical protein